MLHVLGDALVALPQAPDRRAPARPRGAGRASPPAGEAARAQDLARRGDAGRPAISLRRPCCVDSAALWGVSALLANARSRRVFALARTSRGQTWDSLATAAGSSPPRRSLRPATCARSRYATRHRCAHAAGAIGV